MMANIRVKESAILNLPGDIWKEILTIWIHVRMTMKTLSSMDVAMCNSYHRSVWWSIVQDIEWSEDVCCCWRCHLSSIVQSIQWMRSRSVAFRTIDCCFCCLGGLFDHTVPSSISKIVVRNRCGVERTMDEWLSQFRQQLSKDICIISNLEFNIASNADIDIQSAAFSVIADNCIAGTNLTSLSFESPKRWNPAPLCRLLNLIGHQLVNIVWFDVHSSNPVPRVVIETIAACCVSLRSVSLAPLDIPNEESLEAMVRIVANNATTLESIHLQTVHVPSLATRSFFSQLSSRLFDRLWSTNLPSLKHLGLPIVMSLAEMEQLMQQLNNHRPLLQSFVLDFRDSQFERLVSISKRKESDTRDIVLSYGVTNSNCVAILDILTRCRENPSSIFFVICATKDIFATEVMQTSLIRFLTHCAMTLRSVTMWNSDQEFYFPLELILSRCPLITTVQVGGKVESILAPFKKYLCDDALAPRFNVRTLIISEAHSNDDLGLLICCPDLVWLRIICSDITDDAFVLLEKHCPCLRSLDALFCHKITKEGLESYGCCLGVITTVQ